MTRIQVRRPLVVLAAVLVATAGAAGLARAQNVWLDRDRENTIQLEILKPDPEGEDGLTFGSTVWYLSGRFAFNPKVHGLVEMPFATSGIDGAGDFDAGTGWLGGNPYAGIEIGSKESAVLGELGVRLPLGGDRFTTSILGLYSDTERWPAWLTNDVTCIRAGVHVRTRPGGGAGLWFDGRFAPEFVFTSDESEVWATYGAALRLTRPKVRAGASLSGRAFLSDFGDEFGQSTLHEFDLAGDFGTWKFRPGVSLTVPLDEDLTDSINLVYGVSLSYAL